MRLTAWLWKNLNAPEWNRRVWEIGYRGPPLPKQKIKGKPDYPISGNAIRQLQDKMKLEYEVMKCLATPYLNKEMEDEYIKKYGTPTEEQEKELLEMEQRRMPGKPKKRIVGSGKVLKARANVGNLLHEHRTIESSLKELIVRQRWD
uniref:39S ribosomal protein L59, mitochondrial n=1 Tax=Elaeophora elaphi TaxID=1147741 RepID=A0A0R3S574_9BILA